MLSIMACLPDQGAEQTRRMRLLQHYFSITRPVVRPGNGAQGERG
jgi:hypothetical protein